MRETLFQRNVSYIAIPRKLCYGCYKPIAILLLLTGTESSTWNLLKFLLVRSIDYQYLIIAIGPLHFIWNTACLLFTRTLWTIGLESSVSWRILPVKSSRFFSLIFTSVNISQDIFHIITTKKRDVTNQNFSLLLDQILIFYVQSVIASQQKITF